MADSLSNRILSAISSNPTLSSLAGKAGKIVNTLGSNPVTAQITGLNKIPEMGISENLQSAGGAGDFARAQTPQEKAAVEAKAGATAGFSSANAPIVQQQNNPAPTNSGAQLSTDQLIQEYKNRGWTDTSAIMGDIAGGGYKAWNLGGGDSGGGAQPTFNTRDVVSQAPGSKYLNEGDINDLIKEYGDQVTGSTDTLAAAIEKRATDAAEREYQGILSILGGQKSEVGTLSKKQKEQTVAQKELTSQELAAKQESETTSIEKEKAGFEEEKVSTVETLARNWKDMSLEMQRVARARGISDSAFAAGKETDLMLNFNKGLREISTKSLSALKDFSDGIAETVKFYQRQNAQLDLDTNNKISEIDDWERTQIANIQGQETMAYNRKLDAIESAMTQADTLRTNTANTIAEKKMSWGLWLVQQDYAYKQAVAVAAQGKVTDAAANIKKVRDLALQTNDLVTKGGYEITQVNGVPYAHGSINGQDDWIPLTTGQASNLQVNQNNYQAGKPTTSETLAAGAISDTTPSSGGSAYDSFLNAYKTLLGK